MVKITRPDGTEINEEQPDIVETIVTHENAYAMIQDFHLEKRSNPGAQVMFYYFSFDYAVYESKSARDNSYRDWIYRFKSSGIADFEWDPSISIYDHCYNKLKAMRECDGMTDA
jgi:hypothetical protein